MYSFARSPALKSSDSLNRTVCSLLLKISPYSSCPSLTAIMKLYDLGEAEIVRLKSSSILVSVALR